ncbi:MIP family Ig-specific serine endopeptidase [Mycoplasma parvum]|uniref:DUF31 domain-containing protein n=1 Tax=Mycoplasma parvum str. Indiana TaxID=1403316 RepID=U5NFU4_9MOLU|nr:hypothetical protein [Mycoplasma parvum]AGX89118.1 hypothetical protein PRV_01885 [Mycoplasma parvum str. Indiana]
MTKLISAVLAIGGVGGGGFLTKYLWNSNHFGRLRNEEIPQNQVMNVGEKMVSGGAVDNKLSSLNSDLSHRKQIREVPEVHPEIRQIFAKEIGELVQNREEIEKFNEVKKEFYRSHNFAVKNWDQEKSKQIEQKIRDYTVGLRHNCSIGTGWILDYEWPQDENKYPTKWFIATNAHVFERFDFSLGNNFDQKLSQICKGRRASNSSLQLAIWKEKEGEIGQKELKKVSVKETKLFWAARNHLGENSHKNNKDYFHDFIVLEVVFHDQYDAKDATDNFHGKYGKGERTPLNFFNKGITESENNFFDEKTYNTAYYVGGFPARGGEQMTFNHKVAEYRNSTAATLHQSTLNYDLQRLNEGKKSLRGLGDTSFKLKWDGGSSNQELTGFLYWINQTNIGAGGSGSLVVDENENLLGLYSFSWGGDLGGVQPIRSYSLDLSGGKKSPKFDLIRGAGNQTSSYKSQLDKFYANVKTFLREKQTQEFNSSI